MQQGPCGSSCTWAHDVRLFKLKKYEKLLIKIRDLIRSVTKNSDGYDEKYIKNKFNSDEKIPLKKR